MDYSWSWCEGSYPCRLTVVASTALILPLRIALENVYNETAHARKRGNGCTQRSAVPATAVYDASGCMSVCVRTEHGGREVLLDPEVFLEDGVPWVSCGT